eukprot:4092419-Amphidinium_carterae.1
MDSALVNIPESEEEEDEDYVEPQEAPTPMELENGFEFLFLWTPKWGLPFWTSPAILLVLSRLATFHSYKRSWQQAWEVVCSW